MEEGRNRSGTLARGQKRKASRSSSLAKTITSTSLETLSNEATERYGNLGKLIDLEKYYALSFVVEDYTAMGFSAEQAEHMNLEKFKEHSRKLTKMEDDRPKLYGLIMKNMSVESRDEVVQEPNYDT